MGGQGQDRQGQDDDEDDEDNQDDEDGEDQEQDNDMTDGDSEDRRWAGQGRRQAARTGNAFLRGNAGKMRWATNRQLGQTKNRHRGMKQRDSYQSLVGYEALENIIWDFCGKYEAYNTEKSEDGNFLEWQLSNQMSAIGSLFL